MLTGDPYHLRTHLDAIDVYSLAPTPWDRDDLTISFLMKQFGIMKHGTVQEGVCSVHPNYCLVGSVCIELSEISYTSLYNSI